MGAMTFFSLGSLVWNRVVVLGADLSARRFQLLAASLLLENLIQVLSVIIKKKQKHFLFHAIFEAYKFIITINTVH